MENLAYDLHGYAISKNSLDVSLIAQCKLSMPELLDAGGYIENAVTMRSVYEKSPEKFSPDFSPSRIPEGCVYIWPSPLHNSEYFRNLVSSEELWNFAGECLKVPLESLVLNFVQIISKPAGVGPRINWHRDYGNKFISTQQSKNMVRLLIPLQDYQKSNGATAVLPKSHTLTDTAALEGKPIDQLACKKNGINVKIGIGDILAIHPKVIHGSSFNESMYDRDQLVVQLAVRDSVYISSIQKGSSEPYYLKSQLEILG